MTKGKRDFAIAVGAIILTVINTGLILWLASNQLWLAQAIGRMI